VRFEPTPIEGYTVISPELIEDHRGFFARVWDREESLAHGLEVSIAQINLSGSLRAGTIRGLHYQVLPHAEAKVVRCVAGAVFDVCVDLRPGSASAGSWYGIELTAADHRSVHVPPGCAHGYQTLVDGTEVLYTSSTPYHDPSERGVRWDDPALGINWPMREGVSVSDKDASWPDLGADGRGGLTV
jgi:dTDP-4-dehydrorhamnose 3,5-epimerase